MLSYVCLRFAVATRNRKTPRAASARALPKPRCSSEPKDPGSTLVLQTGVCERFMGRRQRLTSGKPRASPRREWKRQVVEKRGTGNPAFGVRIRRFGGKNVSSQIASDHANHAWVPGRDPGGFTKMGRAKPESPLKSIEPKNESHQVTETGCVMLITPSSC